MKRGKAVHHMGSRTLGEGKQYMRWLVVYGKRESSVSNG